MELIGELEDVRRSQSESDNDQITSLSSKLQALQSERDDALTKHLALEKTATELKSMLENKNEEVDARGKDLEQVYKDLEDKESMWAQEREQLQAQIEELREEMQIEADRLRQEREEVEVRAREEVEQMGVQLGEVELKLTQITEQIV